MERILIQQLYRSPVIIIPIEIIALVIQQAVGVVALQRDLHRTLRGVPQT